MNKNVRMEKLYDICGEEKDVRGYKLGNYYLMKIYGWANYYDWAITTKDFNTVFVSEEEQLIKNGTLRFVDNFKQGKKELIRLYEEGVN